MTSETASEAQVTGGGEPTEEELAAIVAAVAATAQQPRPAARSRGVELRWRFSGRWWSKPVPLRRSRPWR